MKEPKCEIFEGTIGRGQQEQKEEENKDENEDKKEKEIDFWSETD